MNKTKAGERKRTVTVVVGPETVELLKEIGKAWAVRCQCPMGELTTVVGVALDHEIQRRQKWLGLPVNSDSATHFD